MPWFMMEFCPRSNPLMLVPPMTGFADLREFGAPKAIGYSLIDSRKGDEKLLFPREPFSKAGQATLEKLLDDPEWGSDLNQTIVQNSIAFFNATDSRLNNVDLATKTDAELAGIYEDLAGFQRRSHLPGLVLVVMEFDHQLLTRYLMDHLQTLIRTKNLPFRASEAFSILTTPLEDSYAQQEEKSLLQIAANVQDVRVRKLFEIQDLDALSERLARMDPQLSRQLDAHVESFCWLPYMYEGPAWDRRYFLQVLQGLLKQDVEALLQKCQTRHDQTRAQQANLLAQLQLDENHTTLLNVAQGMVFTKGFRKDALYHFFWRLEPFLKEVAKRMGLSLKQVRRLMPSEIPAVLRQQATVDADELNARFEHYVQYIHDGEREFFSGAKADAGMERIDMEAHDATSDVRELIGDCACPGVVRGIVRLVESPADMVKMHSGDVLVAHATNPDIVPAMKLAGAIVTDMGGITCHAAIVSRELKIPCVIGTKIATSVLKDGEAVEVDATHGKVTKIRGGEAE